MAPCPMSSAGCGTINTGQWPPAAGKWGPCQQKQGINHPGERGGRGSLDNSVTTRTGEKLRRLSSLLIMSAHI